MDLPDDWTLAATSAAHAHHRGAHVAIWCQDRATTYAELHRCSNRTAHALRAAGIGPGARVAFLGRESEYYYSTVLACAKIGAVLVPVNWRLTAGEVDHIVRDSTAELILVEREFRTVVEQVRAGLPALRRVVELDGDDPGDPGAGLRAWRADAPDTVPEHRCGPHDPVVQIYTSGTTGRPKGVVLAHRSFFTLPAASREAGVDWIDWRADDVALISLPGLGIAGIGWFMHTFNAGGTNVVLRMYLPSEAVRLIPKHRVTTTFVAPAMLAMMLQERGVGPDTFASLRKVAYGAAPISTGLLQRCLEVFGCEFAQIYASTETGTVAVCLPPTDHVPGSGLLRAAGRACPGTEIKIVDREGRPVPPGVMGQVCVRTPARMLGYWNLPEATAATLVGEWLHMGDAGRLDADGYLFLGDRINDTIIVAGQNIYPAEVEKELAEHPAVADVAVVGVAHPSWGDAVHAVVVPRPGRRATGRELSAFLRGRIADYKIPVGYHVADALPRNPSGKVLRRIVRERLQQEAGAAEPTAVPTPTPTAVPTPTPTAVPTPTPVAVSTPTSVAASATKGD
ncbi:long-chain-fatty-acid--CoA ligase [Micromonospora yangpuensis]|uniref:Fatty-acyl-CoA synthase n=1 Tax=Micromonospora yangpuensis TaxID=683228 RepID=A0A1C6UKM3_9ACTN|nr:long-chain-fatty-acid--CoA ligase [Micromonospora yangpuensis]GGM17033.1 acyl-CoA synthetase [Micromonospora yangpuensis]SCL54528.1 fatty-acyl-CoA synthase [Micromonospora yangpuensis]